MIVRALFFLFVILISFSSSGQKVSKQPKKPDIRAVFKKAKKEYLEFERQHGGYIQTDNVRIHYLSWGNPKNTPLIWSHGSLLNSYEIADVAKKLTDAGYYLVAVDYYGHGKTPIPDKEISVYSSADDLLVVMDSLHIGKAIIGGFSRGGYIAAAFYQSYPDRVKGLILEDGGSVAFNHYYHQLSDAELTKKIKSMFANPGAGEIFNRSFDTEMDAFQSLYNPVAAGSSYDLFALIKQKGDKWITYQGMSEFFGMANEDQFMRQIFRPESIPLYAGSVTMIHPKIIFRNLNVPMLILDPVSENDPIPFEKENIALAARFPQLITRIQFDGVAHNIHYAQPDQFVKVLTKFLATVAAKNAN